MEYSRSETSVGQKDLNGGEFKPLQMIMGGKYKHSQNISVLIACCRMYGLNWMGALEWLKSKMILKRKSLKEASMF